MVPDYAEVHLKVEKEDTAVIQDYLSYLNEIKLEGDAKFVDSELVLTLVGKSAHGAEPRNGKNAGILLAEYLKTLELNDAGKKYVQTVAEFYEKSRGEVFGIEYEDEDSGDLTINVGIMSYSMVDGGRVGLNMRYPVTFDIDEGKRKIEATLVEKGLQLDNFTDSKPTYVKKDDPLIKTLQKVYEEQTGEKAELLAIGGGTYSRALDKGVAFGAMFPGREDVMHQKDEYAIVEDLFKASAIYAQAIYELAK